MAAPVIAVVGGGQLARMMAPAAQALGVHLRVLVEDHNSSSAQVVVDAPVGYAGDLAAVLALVDPPFGPRADVLTVEHEHVPEHVLAAVGAHVPVRPGADALRCAQDKSVMRRAMAELDVACPQWMELPRDPAVAHASLTAFLTTVGGAGVVKTARGGYDGKGVRTVTSAEEVSDWIAAAAAGGSALLVEERVDFSRELAVLVARSPSGGTPTVWPVVESVQRDGVCAEVIAPALGLDRERAAQIQQMAQRIATSLDVTGVMAVELFETTDGRVLVNELAMRPHNSGHWTIEGSSTSQFAQHVRAVLDLPLGPVGSHHPWTVMVNVLGTAHGDPVDRLGKVLAAVPDAHVHLYGKQARAGRKLGHVTVCGTDVADLRAQAQCAARILTGDAEPEETR